jgi:hypothetical protein
MDAAMQQLRKLSGKIAGFTLIAGAAWLLSSRKRSGRFLPRWIPWVGAVMGAAITANEFGRQARAVPALVLPADGGRDETPGE